MLLAGRGNWGFVDDEQVHQGAAKFRVLMAANVARGSGGVADHIRALSEALRQRGYDVELFLADDVSRHLPGFLDSLAFSWAVGCHARRERPQVLHSHTSTGVIAQLICARSTTCVTTSHGDERALWDAERSWSRQGTYPIRPWSRLLVPAFRLPQFDAAIRGADSVIALHEVEAAAYRGRRAAEPTSVQVIPNGALPAHGAARPVPGRIVYVGTWIARKGSLTLVEAFAAARSDLSDLSLRLVGPADSAVSDFHLVDQASVMAMGHVPAEVVAEELRHADVLVLPSLFEGMPLVALNALSHGVPVVATDLPGTRAAVDDAGVLIPAGDAAALAQALVRVTRHRKERERLGGVARARAASATWDAVAGLTIEVYERATRLRPRGRLGRWGRLFVRGRPTAESTTARGGGRWASSRP